jgi:hypothetical protein
VGGHGLGLDPVVGEALRAGLPDVAARTVGAIAVEVPEYAGQMAGAFRTTVENAVQLALGGFLRAAEEARGTGIVPLPPVVDAAYALGRGEARSGRTMSALLAAYRVGARVSWQAWGATCVEHDVPAETVARLAELVFSYIDALSAASVTGHSDQLATSGRVREQYRERLALGIVEGQPEDRLLVLAERAEWEPPAAVAAVIMATSEARTLAPVLGPAALALPGDVVDLGVDADLAVLLVPAPSRRALLQPLRGIAAIVGPTRPWSSASASLARARRHLVRHGLDGDTGNTGNTGSTGSTGNPVDTDDRLVELVLTADDDALADLRARALGPLSAQRPDTAERLAETLRSWLLHQGRREAVAADLHVHPQTVRYRMTQLRELFGDVLTDPDRVLELTVALAVPQARTARLADRRSRRTATLVAQPNTPFDPLRESPASSGRRRSNSSPGTSQAP